MELGPSVFNCATCVALQLQSNAETARQAVATVAAEQTETAARGASVGDEGSRIFQSFNYSVYPVYPLTSSFRVHGMAASGLRIAVLLSNC